MCSVLQIVGEGVAWRCRAWSTSIGCYKVFSLDSLECNQDSYYLSLLDDCVAACRPVEVETCMVVYTQICNLFKFIVNYPLFSITRYRCITIEPFNPLDVT